MKCKVHKCNACCCYNIPFERFELERYKDKIVNPILFTLPQGPYVVAFTDADPANNKCPFLRADYKCNIYENRPEVCRLFGIVPQMPCKWLKK